jgi:predicted phosphodiesterase
MSLSENLKNLAVPGRMGSDVRALNTPENWQPRLELSEDGGYLVSQARPAGENPDLRRILIEEFKLDPDLWDVASVRQSRWQKYDGEWLEAFRLTLVPVQTKRASQEDIDKLTTQMMKWRPSKKSKKTDGELAFVFAPSDQQLGKKANGHGTEQTIERIFAATEGAVQRLHDLRKMGRSIGTVVISLLGDHVEGNVSQAGRLQSHSASDMGLTEQARVGRRLLLAQVKAFAPLADKIIVAAVNGNHDEVSRQVALDPSEGWNTAIANEVQDICAENEALSHVEFRYPSKDHQTLAINVCDTMLGLFHGHQTGKDVLRYLSEQAAGQTPLGGCDVWLSGHYHSFRSMDIGERFWAQCPTVDPGSAWYRDRRGLESNPGILTMVIGQDHSPRLDLSIIPAR